ncbi:TrmH family RNA methyltransferase [Candidatus Omnitrophota bacterium]
MAKKITCLYGKKSVLERLVVDPGSIKGIFVRENFNDSHILNEIKKRNVPSRTASEKELIRIKRADRVQGIVAEVNRFEYVDFDDLINEPNQSKRSLVFLDGVNDPHNLGSIIRITACIGNFAIVIPKHESAQVNDTVIHVASGGENYTPVATVNNIATALIKAKSSGYWAAGAVVEGGDEIGKAKIPFPVACVLGSEGKGIGHAVSKQLDIKITLPMRGAQLSFNVAMACAIICHEIDKQRPR